MNVVKHLFVCLLGTLLLAAGRGQADVAVWSDNFDTGGANWASSGVWHIRTPTLGPNAAYSPPYCATTEYYALNQNVRLSCISYLNGSNTLVVPDASVSPTLTFWNWLGFANAEGYVEVKGDSNEWQQISPTYLNINSAGQWVQTSLSLSNYAGQKVQIGFHFISGGFGNSLGWYVDNVAVTVNSPTQLSLPTNQTVFAGQVFTLTVTATNTYAPAARYTYSLLGAPKYATITTNGVLTIQPPTNQPSVITNFIVRAVDNSSPPQTATNTFSLNVVNPWIPTLQVDPAVQTIYPGQTATATCTATNPFFPNDSTFNFQLVTNSPAMTNWVGPDLAYPANNAITFSWQVPINQRAGTNKVVVAVTDPNLPGYRATNSFLIIVNTNTPPPTLTLPGQQTIYYGGLPLDVVVSASSVFDNDTFTFALTNSPAAADIAPVDSSSAEITWTPAATNAGKVFTITVAVTDDTSQLTTRGSFQVIVAPTPAPSLVTIAATNFAGQTLAVDLEATNNIGTTGMFTFNLLSNTNDAWIDVTNSVLNWTNTAVTNGVLVWTNPAVAPGTRTLSIRITDQNSGLMATNHFSMVFLAPLPPALLVPTNWTLSFGQTVTNMLLATNSAPTNSLFTFALATNNISQVNSNVVVRTNGLVIWTNTAAPPGTYAVVAQVKDNSRRPALSTTNNFSVHIVPPSTQLVLTNTSVITSNNVRFTIATTWTNRWTNGWVILASTNLVSGTNWVPIFTNRTGPGASVTFTDQVGTNTLQRFYRAMYQ